MARALDINKSRLPGRINKFTETGSGIQYQKVPSTQEMIDSGMNPALAVGRGIKNLLDPTVKNGMRKIVSPEARQRAFTEKVADDMQDNLTPKVVFSNDPGNRELFEPAVTEPKGPPLVSAEITSPPEVSGKAPEVAPAAMASSHAVNAAMVPSHTPGGALSVGQSPVAESPVDEVTKRPSAMAKGAVTWDINAQSGDAAKVLPINIGALDVGTGNQYSKNRIGTVNTEGEWRRTKDGQLVAGNIGASNPNAGKATGGFAMSEQNRLAEVARQDAVEAGIARQKSADLAREQMDLTNQRMGALSRKAEGARALMETGGIGGLIVGRQMLAGIDGEMNRTGATGAALTGSAAQMQNAQVQADASILNTATKADAARYTADREVEGKQIGALSHSLERAERARAERQKAVYQSARLGLRSLGLAETPDNMAAFIAHSNDFEKYGQQVIQFANAFEKQDPVKVSSARFIFQWLRQTYFPV